MLGRLFKYEMKAMAKLLIPIYTAFIAISAISRISLCFWIDESSPLYFLTNIGVFIFAISAVTTLAATAIIIVWRFYRNTSSDEGYLLFTLPVKTDYIIISEFLCAFIWSAIMSVAVIIGIFLMIINRDIDGATLSFSYLSELFSQLSADGIKALFVVLADLIISTLAEIMMAYCAIALASLFKKYRLMLSAVFYIALVTIVNLFGTVLLQIVTPSFVQGSYEVETDSMLSFADAFNNYIAPEMLSAGVLVDFIYIIVTILAQYFIVRYILKKHLNIS